MTIVSLGRRIFKGWNHWSFNVNKGINGLMCSDLSFQDHGFIFIKWKTQDPHPHSLLFCQIPKKSFSKMRLSLYCILHIKTKMYIWVRGFCICRRFIWLWTGGLKTGDWGLQVLRSSPGHCLPWNCGTMELCIQWMKETDHCCCDPQKFHFSSFLQWIGSWLAERQD